MIPELDSVIPVKALLDIADDLLREHAAARELNPEQPEPQILLDALATTRTLLKHAPRHPDLWQPLYALTERIIAAAEAARTDLRTLDLSSRSYLRVILAARSLQITLADKAQQVREKEENQAARAVTKQTPQAARHRQPISRRHSHRGGDDGDDNGDGDALILNDANGEVGMAFR